MSKGSREYVEYSRRYYENDTIVNLTYFKKYRWETFKNSNQIENVTFEYEHIGKSKYILLDEKLNEVHSFNFDKSPQEGKIFYGEAAIIYDEIDGKNFPSDNQASYKKFSLNEYKYVVFSEDFDKVEMVSNEEKVRIILQGEKIDMVCGILDDEKFIADKPSFASPGDKIQYEVWTTTVSFGFSNDMPTQETRETYHVEDIITQEYIGDTVINSEVYSKLFIVMKDVEKDKEDNIIAYVNINNNNLIFLDKDEEFKLEYSSQPKLTLDSQRLIFQGAMEFSLGGGSFTKYISWSLSGYETLISFVSVFPCPMIEMWGHDNKITYLKVDGVEYGELK